VLYGRRERERHVSRSGLLVGTVSVTLSFVWTEHAIERLSERGISHEEVEWAIRELHPSRERGSGEADWHVDTGRIVVVYDHPHRGNAEAVRIVTVWRRRRQSRRHLRAIGDNATRGRYPEP
jgi:hypothetical protein